MRKPLPDKGSERAADHEHRREYTTRGSRAERQRPDCSLHHEYADDERQAGMPAEKRTDHVVANAESARFDQSAHANDQAADRRPPHPMDWQARKSALGPVDQMRRADGDRGAGDPDRYRQNIYWPTNFSHPGSDWKYWR